MKKFINFQIWILLLIGLILGSVSLTLAEEKKPLKAYVMIQIDIKNQNDFFGKYGPTAGPTIFANEGRVLVATFNKDIKEGKWENNWTVVLEFPSTKAANAWYHSNEYQKAIPYRLASTGYTNMVFVEEFKQLPPQQ